MIELKEFINKKGEIILFSGNPNLEILEIVSNGLGDIWHSSFEQGFKNLFPEIVYQTSTFYRIVKDFDC